MLLNAVYFGLAIAQTDHVASIAVSQKLDPIPTRATPDFDAHRNSVIRLPGPSSSYGCIFSED